jgi:sucrose-6-phosphate hydrolase SacC (GH32 family)
MYDAPRKLYAIYTKMWIDRPDGGMYWKHAMGCTISSDFLHWSTPELVLAPDDLDPTWVEFHASSFSQGPVPYTEAGPTV